MLSQLVGIVCCLGQLEEKCYFFEGQSSSSSIYLLILLYTPTAKLEEMSVMSNSKPYVVSHI